MLSLSRLFSTVFLLLVLVFSNNSLTAQAYGGKVSVGGGGGPLNNQISLYEPYNCGKDMYGGVTNGIMPFRIRIELYRNGSLAYTYTPSVDSNNQFRVVRPDRDVPSGVYNVVVKSTDALDNTGQVSYTADIKKPEECNPIELVTSEVNRISGSLVQVNESIVKNGSVSPNTLSLIRTGASQNIFYILFIPAIIIVSTIISINFRKRVER